MHKKDQRIKNISVYSKQSLNSLSKSYCEIKPQNPYEIKKNVWQIFNEGNRFSLLTFIDSSKKIYVFFSQKGKALRGSKKSEIKRKCYYWIYGFLPRMPRLERAYCILAEPWHGNQQVLSRNIEVLLGRHIWSVMSTVKFYIIFLKRDTIALLLT